LYAATSLQRIAQTDALQLRQPVKVLADGEIGKIIAVRYTRSELVVQATIIAARRVNNCSKTMC
jgi:flagella basal body P-ring formation protein FlgA